MCVSVCTCVCACLLLHVFTLFTLPCVCVCKAVDLGEELIHLGHAVSCQDEANGLRGDHDEPRSLQKLLVRNSKQHVLLFLFSLIFLANGILLLVYRMT